jgi:hypothetical protein
MLPILNDTMLGVRPYYTTYYTTEPIILVYINTYNCKHDGWLIINDNNKQYVQQSNIQ